MRETPEQRHNRGAAMIAVSNADFGDLAYLRSIEAALSAEHLEQFRAILFTDEVRGSAGIRGAADMAVRKLREQAAGEIAGGVVASSWRAGR